MKPQPFRPHYSFALAAIATLFVACGQPDGASLDEELGQDDTTQMESEIRQVLTVTEFSDPNGVNGRAKTETRVVIRTAAGYVRYFGHAAPADVEFAQGDVVIFYAAGVQSTGGYDARIVSAAEGAAGLKLFVTTQLVAPGADCFVTQVVTLPYVLAKVRPSKKPLSAQFKQSNVTKSCSPEANPCMTVKCTPDTHCEVIQVQCFTTPCNPIAQCVPNETVPPGCAATSCPAGTVCKETNVQCITAPCPPQVECVPVAPPPEGSFCGGIAGIQCPSNQTCVDDPNDSCDPASGGADCGGICKATVKEGSFCGGIAGIQCPSNQTCADDPNDSCDPKSGGADCGGICKATVKEGSFCGGIAGIQCPSKQTCVDDPNDSCDPKSGGADCGGICKAT